MNKSAIIIGVITLVLFGACRDYESVAYTQPVEVEKYDGTFLESLSDEACSRYSSHAPVSTVPFPTSWAAGYSVAF